MSEFLYEAQRYFPSKCSWCPFLIGLIEDGFISPSEDVSPSEIFGEIREAAHEHNFEHCPGPLVLKEDAGEESTCMSFPIDDIV